jgi:hypothetical protein
MALETCGECKWKYPEHLLNRMFIGGQGYTPPICAICALEITNKVHGANLKEFHGEIAEHMRQLAIQWRKKNKKHKPVEV